MFLSPRMFVGPTPPPLIQPPFQTADKAPTYSSLQQLLSSRSQGATPLSRVVSKYCVSPGMGHSWHLTYNILGLMAALSSERGYFPPFLCAPASHAVRCWLLGCTISRSKSFQHTMESSIRNVGPGFWDVDSSSEDLRRVYGG